MKEKIKSIPWKITIYTLIFGMVCLISQRVHTAPPPSGWKECFRDMLGFPVALLIILHYKKEAWRECRLFHVVWALCGCIGCLAWFVLRRNSVAYIQDFIVVVLEVYVWGFVLIQTLYTVFHKKICPTFNRPCTILCLLMVGWMIISRSDEIWPLPYAIIFMCFYVTDFDKEEQSQFFQGILNGIILSFFVFQAHCFLYRPYDEVRYKGWFTNSNSNALFYCFVLAAVLLKLYMCYRNKTNLWWRIYYWLGIGVVFSFEIMTIGRIGCVTAFVLALLFLIAIKRCFGKKIILNGLLILLSTAVTFPLCFAAARYIPPLRHHVYWFYGEWAEDKVHSWDAWNSEKFIDIDEFGEAALGRVTRSLGDLWKHMPFVIEADAMTEEERATPMFASSVIGNDSLIIRKYIYMGYWKQLNLMGHPSREIGFQLTESYWAYHAHSIYLQFGILFGIPVMIMFAIMAVVSLWKCGKQFLRTNSVQAMGYGYFILIPSLFGLFEYTWGAGHMAITLLFIAWRMILIRDKQEDSKEL